jgi:hypothetical protein
MLIVDPSAPGNIDQMVYFVPSPQDVDSPEASAAPSANAVAVTTLGIDVECELPYQGSGRISVDGLSLPCYVTSCRNSRKH